jgi:hypothetical protein
MKRYDWFNAVMFFIFSMLNIEEEKRVNLTSRACCRLEIGNLKNYILSLLKEQKASMGLIWLTTVQWALSETKGLTHCTKAHKEHRDKRRAPLLFLRLAASLTTSSLKALAPTILLQTQTSDSALLITSGLTSTKTKSLAITGNRKLLTLIALIP